MKTLGRIVRDTSTDFSENFAVGDYVRWNAVRPRWWRLIALWKYWREKNTVRTFRVTGVSKTEMTVE